MAQITEVSTTESSITVRVSGLGTTAKYCEFYLDGALKKNYTLSGTSQSHTYTGLRPGRTYTCSAIVYNANWEPLTFKDNSIDIETDSVQEYQQVIVYHSGSATPRRQTIQGDDQIRDGGDFFTAPSGFSFYGWAKSTGDKSPDYYAGDSYTATSSNDLDLYAIWKYEDATGVTFYYGYNEAKANHRKLLGYAYNTSSSRQTTEYESVLTPVMKAGDITVVDRSFSPIGWRGDTRNNGSGLTGGEEYIAVSQSKCVFYAVYQNTAGIHVTYKPNGGSGTMASSTVPGTMYYNTGQTAPTKISITPRDCEFTPPKGSQFQGWATTADGSVVTSLRTSYDVTFYAQWTSARPADWDWSGYLYLDGVKKPYNMTVGGKPPMVEQADGSYYAYYMGAAEWNKFIKRIQDVASYLEIGLNARDISGASATAGQKMLAYQAQCVVNMLNALGASNIPDVPSSMSVSFFYGIRDSLNNRKNR